MKRIIFIFLCCFTLSFAFAQSATDKTNPNYEHDRITKMWMDSKDQSVSTEAKIVLKNRALGLKMQEAKMMRNLFLFQVLENKRLSIEDRMWAADVYIKGAADDISYPVDYIKTLRAKLASQKN